MLEGKYTNDTVFPPDDHRNHRPRSWLLNGIKKIDQLRFLESPARTLGQAAIQWLLHDPRTLSVLPNIYGEDQLREFTEASDSPPLTPVELEKVAALVASGFGLDPEPGRYKGTMELPAELAAAIA
jgi:aryl-alcohol dehydrogenase-like predicted oxidoreductase